MTTLTLPRWFGRTRSAAPARDPRPSRAKLRIGIPRVLNLWSTHQFWIGFFGALELGADKPTRRFFPNRGEVGTICRDHCFANGLVMRAVRDTMIISPPLVMERAHIDELVEKAWRCLDLTARDITKT